MDTAKFDWMNFLRLFVIALIVVFLASAADGRETTELKNFHGESAYIITDDIAIDDYKSVVIHCEAYSKLWGGSRLRTK